MADQPVASESLFTMATPVAIFKWQGQLPEEPTGRPERFSDDYGEQMAYELAYPAVSSLVDALRAEGVTCDDPWQDELGWRSDFQFGTKSVRLFVNWTAIDYPPNNYIAIQWHVRRTFIEWILRKNVRSEIEAQVQKTIQNALVSVSLVDGLQRLTDEQFTAAYCRGEPLPEA